MAELKLSYVCRKCHAGWWAAVAARLCPRCNGPLVVLPGFVEVQGL